MLSNLIGVWLWDDSPEHYAALVIAVVIALLAAAVQHYRYRKARFHPPALAVEGKRGRVRALATSISPSGEPCAAFRASLYNLDQIITPSPIFFMSDDSLSARREPFLEFQGAYTEGLLVEFEDGTSLEVPRGDIQLDARSVRTTKQLLPHTAVYLEAKHVTLPTRFEIDEVVLRDGDIVEFIGGTELRSGDSSSYRTPVLVPTGLPLLVAR